MEEIAIVELIAIVDDRIDETSLVERELSDDFVDVGWDTEITTDPVEIGTNEELGVSVGKDDEMSLDSVDEEADE